MLTRESPNPPPDFVAYTDGVLFKISGNSCEPNFSTISADLIVETAIGVFLSLAMSMTLDLITISSNWFDSEAIFIFPKSIVPVFSTEKFTVFV